MTHVLVVGAYGSAGVAAAEGLLDAVGEDIDRLTLADDGEPGGGLCILRGCMPSKEVLSAAAHRYEARHDDRLVGDPPEMDLERIVERKDEHVSDFAAHRRGAVHEMADRPGVEFRHERAEFVGERTLRVGDDRIEADYVVVATGSEPVVPDIPGMDEVEYYGSADTLDATELPDSAVVMGFGFVGVELAPYLAEAGVDVTVVEHDERPLDEADPAFGDEILSMYREEFGIEVLTETYETRVEPTDEGVRLHVEGPDGGRSAVDAEGLFCFTGRRPNARGLGLERAGLSVGPKSVTETMRSVDDPRVFVPGDANGKEPILHVAKEQGYLVAENILADLRGESLEAYENVHHHVVFSGASVYPYARVGHSEASAAAAGLDHVVARREASDDGVFKTKAAPRGRATLVAGTDGTVLGYQGLHYHADAMAKTMQVVVERGMDVRTIPDRAYHPTTPEILDGLIREAAEKVERA
ncbi:dihydrolipoyl dehydrogenase family protein [Halopelagius longus]|uniref:Dihydrolipoamide dehydrogenase n=1 Tax=Halopelagius longus TaxID=1236180 RepID=A0A1H1DN85_9EURY|nr:NAD(P)/FAD-dependent oxidoreductase [Halopelagius longus]RDI71393.1 NAD(P)/FAD-dependent oxidoreductase [Halopelagius longus]SDQ77688.1 dihydrolipoamide dehydrogenase [Halopelagius longus]